MKGELERKTTFWSMERMKKERRKARGKTGWKDEKKEAWRPGSESKSLIFLPGEKYLNLFTVLQLSWMSGRLTAVMLKARCIMGAVVECYDTQTSIKRLEAECERNCRLWGFTWCSPASAFPPAWTTIYHQALTQTRRYLKPKHDLRTQKLHTHTHKKASRSDPTSTTVIWGIKPT